MDRISIKSRKAKSEEQKESKISTLLAPVKEYFRSRSRSRSPSSQQSRQPSPGPTPQADEQGYLINPQYISGREPVTNDLWSKAYQQLPEEYKEGLGNSDKLDILQKLLAIAKQAEEQNTAKQLQLKWGDKIIDVRKKVQGFVGWLNEFKEIGDIAVQYDLVHAALPWAGVRFILIVCDPPSQLDYPFSPFAQ